MKLLFVAVSGMLMSAAAFAQATGPAGGSGDQASAGNQAQVEENAAEEEGDERRVCRRIETGTGSRVPPRRVCMTAREWRAQSGGN